MNEKMEKQKTTQEKKKWKLAELNFRAVIIINLLLTGTTFSCLYYFHEASLTLQCTLLIIAGLVLTLWLKRIPNYEIIATVILQVFFMGGIQADIIISIILMFIFLYAGVLQGFFVLKLNFLKNKIEINKNITMRWIVYNCFFLILMFMYSKYIIKFITKITNMLNMNFSLINIIFALIIYFVIIFFYILITKRISLIFLVLFVSVICMNSVYVLVGYNATFDTFLKVLLCIGYSYFLISFVATYIYIKIIIK